MKFVADSMLGKLARWLRILGYDTTYDPLADDDTILNQALTEDRILLTRDRPLADRSSDGRSFLIAHDGLDDQMLQLVQTLGLDLDRETFTLCLVCNEPILQVQAEAVQDRIPPYVYETQRRFHECPKCSRVYWQGTHLNRMNSRLEKIKEHAENARKEIP